MCNRQVSELERQATSSRVRLGKLSRLRELQAAGQALKNAAAAERAQARALEQDLMEQDARRWALPQSHQVLTSKFQCSSFHEH